MHRPRFLLVAVYAALLVILLGACAPAAAPLSGSSSSQEAAPAVSATASNAANLSDAAQGNEVQSAQTNGSTLVNTGSQNSSANSSAGNSDESAAAQPAASQPASGSKPAANTAADAANISALGPDQFPASVNPLTGLPVENPSLLNSRPAFVSVSNFPVSARPQAGLSFSPYVFEMYIGEGMTRFLAMFYGNYPHAPATNQVDDSQYRIGPIRSGRLPYESVRKLYNGFLVMASASSEVGLALSDSANIFGSDSNDINSALIDVSKLEKIAASHPVDASGMNLTGNQFNAGAPQGGKPASQLDVFYSFLNQAQWTYDASSGAYLRAQDKADGSGKFYPATDRLTKQQLAFNNVIVLLAKHTTLNRAKTLIDIDMLYTSGYAYLFRDGQVYPIRWSTVNGDYEKKTGLLRPMRFTNADGTPFSMKPGNTWVEVVDVTAGVYEKQPGVWMMRFYAP